MKNLRGRLVAVGTLSAFVWTMGVGAALASPSSEAWPMCTKEDAPAPLVSDGSNDMTPAYPASPLPATGNEAALPASGLFSTLNLAAPAGFEAGPLDATLHATPDPSPQGPETSDGPSLRARKQDHWWHNPLITVLAFVGGAAAVGYAVTSVSGSSTSN